jgi:hypothetical protein
MCGETVSFRERYDFDPASWIKWQLEQWQKMTGTSRDIRKVVSFGMPPKKP